MQKDSAQAKISSKVAGGGGTFLTHSVHVYADVDECDGALGVCGTAEAAIACQNAPGNYSCTCQQGFHFDGKTCAGQLSPVTRHFHKLAQ